MSDLPFGPLLLLAVGIIIVVVVLRKASSHFAGIRSEVSDSDGQEIFRGSAKEAVQVIHTLADADGRHGVFVDHEQHQDVPALLAVQQQMSNSNAAKA